MKKDVLFEDVIKEWLEEKKLFIKYSTYAYYTIEAKNYIIPILGKRPVKEITEKELQRTIMYWQKEGGNCHNPLKKSTVQNLVTITKQCIKFAIKEGYMEECALDLHFIPTNYHKKKKVFSKSEQVDIIQAVLGEPSYRTFGILLCLNSGLRIGELCALRWEDFDFKNGIIHITKTLQRVYDPASTPKTKIVISSPKTLTSNRDIPLSAKMVEFISQLEINKMGYVLTNENRYMEPRTFRKFYAHFLQRHGIAALNVHCLRHTFATRCIENGGDYKSVSEILGHTTINTTLNMYVHPQLEEKRKCVDLIQW